MDFPGVLNVVLQCIYSRRACREQARPLHLVKDGIMTGVDLIPSVDVRCEKPVLVSTGKELDLVCRGVCAQQKVAVHVVAILERAAGMVGRKRKVVEILFGCH